MIDNQSPRIVGIGGLNLDYIVSKVGLDPFVEADRRAFLAQFSPASETTVSEQTLRRLVSSLAPEHVAIRPGGSSFNALIALAEQGSFSLGFVGCIGERPSPSPIEQAMTKCRIDCRHVAVAAGREHGSCLSIQVSGDRWLATTRGANDETASRLRHDREGVSAYLSQAAIVHISSLLDAEAPTAILAVLRRARQLNPALRISLDPGAHWSRIVASDPALRALGELADWLFLNGEEFRNWRSSGLLARSDATVFRKAPGRIALYVRIAGRGLETRDVRQPIIAASQIQDPTGAGDHFAAGALSVLVYEPTDLMKAANTGLTLARRRLMAAPF